jgi:hypothetical protein
VLYQLSYIGENPVVSYQPSALANPTLTLPSALLVLTTAVRAHHLFAMHPGLGREQRQDGQRRQANSEIFQCAPRECAESGERRQRDEQPVHSNPFTPNGWCTGKDSNLRTSEEGQIYSLLALTTHPPVQNCRTVRPLLAASPPAFLPTIRHSSQIFTPAYGDRLGRILQKYGFANVKNRNARENAIARKHHTWKIPLWSAVGKSVKPPRRIFCVRNQCWSWRRDLNP